MLHDIFRAVEAMNPSKDACMYWQVLNRILLKADDRVAAIWRTEKIASLESIKIAQREALAFLSAERERIMRLSREEAIQEMLKQQKIENKMHAVKSVADNGLLELGEAA